MGHLTCLQPNPVGFPCTTWQLLALCPPCTSGFHIDVAACYPRSSASVGEANTWGGTFDACGSALPVHPFLLSAFPYLTHTHTHTALAPHSEPRGLPSVHCPEQQLPVQTGDSSLTFQCYWFLADLISEFTGHLCPRPCSLGLQD